MDPRVFTVLGTETAETVSGGAEGLGLGVCVEKGLFGLGDWGDRRIHRKGIWRPGSKINILAETNFIAPEVEGRSALEETLVMGRGA